MIIPFRYDAEVDAGYIKLSDAPVDHTIDLEPTTLGLPVLIDVDSSGALVGIEILNVTTTAPALA
ncbi:DUF2283 domain-containing protein [Agromyces mediolanus]|uniref:DUF2283 domain-containing protein n=1 Tax=Agromyces mediolanus TaxID=41986 RepID=UPI001E33B378|nr:DUF2283 domain-containing protein [Agromyces mediolanus]MCD1571314.1 DUF2283 domain-containing protein [Agromyces mediolanus]